MAEHARRISPPFEAQHDEACERSMQHAFEKYARFYALHCIALPAVSSSTFTLSVDHLGHHWRHHVRFFPSSQLGQTHHPDR